MADQTKVAAELKARMIAAGLNQKSLARAAGVPEGYVRDILRGKSKNPTGSRLQLIAEALECGVNDLLRTRPRMQSIQANRPLQSDFGGIKLTTAVPELDVYVGMGAGGLMDDERTLGAWQLPTEWLRSEIRSAAPDRVYIVTVEGDSMAGTLEPGDKVIVDVDRRSPSPPGLFILWDGIAQVAKRLEYVERSEPPRVRVISDNRRYEPYERTAEEINIVGRIMGRWQRLS